MGRHYDSHPWHPRSRWGDIAIPEFQTYKSQRRNDVEKGPPIASRVNAFFPSPSALATPSSGSGDAGIENATGGGRILPAPSLLVAVRKHLAARRSLIGRLSLLLQFLLISLGGFALGRSRRQRVLSQGAKLQIRIPDRRKLAGKFGPVISLLERALSGRNSLAKRSQDRAAEAGPAIEIFVTIEMIQLGGQTPNLGHSPARSAAIKNPS